MKIVIVLQILSVLFQYRIVNALYNFGFKSEPEDPKRIRIYLEEDERLLVPKDSKIEYVSPDEDEVILDKPPSPPLIYQGLKKPLPPQFLHNKISTPVGLYQKPAFTLEDLRVKTDLSGFPKVHLDQQEGHFKPQAQFEGQATSYGQLNAIYSQVKDSPIAYGKLLRPILLLPNGWIHGVNLDNNNYNYEKPVTESHPDDLKEAQRYHDDNLRFLQGGAPPHYPLRQFLEETFPGRWIGTNGAIKLPERSPDLSTLDYRCVIYNIPL